MGLVGAERRSMTQEYSLFCSLIKNVSRLRKQPKETIFFSRVLLTEYMIA